MPEHDGPIPFYPALPCWRAPLRPVRDPWGELRASYTPREDCRCRVCLWARERTAGEIALDQDGPVRPGTPAWGALLTLAGVPA